MSESLTPPQPESAPPVAQMRPAVLQAMRAAQMLADGSSYSEYQQPAHAFLAKVMPDSPELHRQVALPGAKRAIHLDALNAFHERGLSDVEIVAEINSSTDLALLGQRQAFETWRDGERREVLDRARQRDQRRQALLAAREAEIEKELDRQQVVTP